MKRIDRDDLAWLTPPNDARHPPDYAYFEGAVAHPFADGAAGFSLANACWLADAALLAYSDGDEAAARYGAVGMALTPFAAAATQCHVAHDAERVIVAFRGTQVFKIGARGWADLALREVLHDWLTDVDVRVVRDGAHGAVHRGFLDALLAVWPQVAGHLQTLAAAHPERPVWFTGHSSGGALATLAASRFDGRATLYTYGSPRVGDVTFRDAFGSRPVFRVVHASDLVPTLPRAGYASPHALIPFAHVGQPVMIDRDGRVLVRPADAPIPDAASQPRAGLVGRTLGAIRQKWRCASLCEGVVDHAPIFYASVLWNALLSRGEAA